MTQKISPLPRGMDRPGAVCAKGYVYLFGGYDDGAAAWSPTIYAAKVASDGTLGNWFAAGKLAARGITGFPAVMVVRENYIVMAGHWDGVVAGHSYSDVAVWRIDPATGLLTQVHAGGLPNKIGGASICYHNGYVYTLGGFDDGGAIVNHVYRARLNTDGTMTPWQTMSDFPGGRFVGFAAVKGDSVYLIGGIGTGGATPKILMGRFNSEGDIGNWVDCGKQSSIGKRAAPGACRVGDTVYLAGGTDAAGNAHGDTIAVHLGPDGVAVVNGPNVGDGGVGDMTNSALVHTGHVLISLGGIRNVSPFDDLKTAVAFVPPSDLH